MNDLVFMVVALPRKTFLSKQLSHKHKSSMEMFNNDFLINIKSEGRCFLSGSFSFLSSDAFVAFVTFVAFSKNQRTFRYTRQ